MDIHSEAENLSFEMMDTIRRFITAQTDKQRDNARARWRKIGVGIDKLRGKAKDIYKRDIEKKAEYGRRVISEVDYLKKAWLRAGRFLNRNLYKIRRLPKFGVTIVEDSRSSLYSYKKSEDMAVKIRRIIPFAIPVKF